MGKRTLALAAARALLCEAGGEESCGTVLGLRSHRRAALHPDVIAVGPDDKGSIKIEPVRDLAREIGARPFEGRARAFVVDDAHAMTEQAMNALLKSLEEPAASSHVFLVTGSPQALLPTIRSRCQVLRFGPIPHAVLERHLVERHGVDPADARLRAALSGGSLGGALAFETEGYRATARPAAGRAHRGCRRWARWSGWTSRSAWPTPRTPCWSWWPCARSCATWWPRARARRGSRS